jgi:organic hydroperoxide reductase OsmC/OhrA
LTNADDLDDEGQTAVITGARVEASAMTATVDLREALSKTVLNLAVKGTEDWMAGRQSQATVASTCPVQEETVCEEGYGLGHLTLAAAAGACLGSALTAVLCKKRRTPDTNEGNQVQVDKVQTDQTNRDKTKVTTADKQTMSQRTFVRTEHKFQRLKEETSEKASGA